MNPFEARKQHGEEGYYSGEAIVQRLFDLTGAQKEILDVELSRVNLSLDQVLSWQDIFQDDTSIEARMLFAEQIADLKNAEDAEAQKSAAILASSLSHV